jgi:hypothetical protein
MIQYENLRHSVDMASTLSCCSILAWCSSSFVFALLVCTVVTSLRGCPDSKTYIPVKDFKWGSLHTSLDASRSGIMMNNYTTSSKQQSINRTFPLDDTQIDRAHLVYRQHKTIARDFFANAVGVALILVVFILYQERKLTRRY